MPASTTRKRGVLIGPGSEKPGRKPFKTPPCITRLVVEDAEYDNNAFAVTVFNAGNLPSHHVHINIYLEVIGGEPGDGPLLVATGKTTLGILERKRVSVVKQLGGIAANNHYYAVAFDPIKDPFPVGRIRQLYLQERNLLASSLWYSLPGWKQYTFDDDLLIFDYRDGAVPDEHRTWQLNRVSELEEHRLPANPRITEVLFPHVTPADHSELRYQVDIDSPFFLSEIAKGNVTIQSSCMLYTFAQIPRDRGGFWLRQSRLQNGVPSTLSFSEPPLTSPDTWIDYPLVNQAGQIDAHPSLTTIFVRLIARRRSVGRENSAYFGNARCALKHRQVKVARASNA